MAEWSSRGKCGGVIGQTNGTYTNVTCAWIADYDDISGTGQSTFPDLEFESR